MTEQCHFIGIGGIGMSGLARIMLSRQATVTGSDIAANYVTEGLIRDGAKVFIGHSAEYISAATTVVYSTDIKKDNPEYSEAVRLKCPVLHRSDFLKQLTVGYKTLSVTGTHGKTTTSALLSATLKTAGLDPSFAVGGIMPQFHSNAGHGKGEYFVAEADESDGTFLKYDSYGAIITNIDFDHMNHFGTESELIQAFHTFAKSVSSSKHLFWCGDDVRLKALALSGIGYGFGPDCILRVIHWEQQEWHLVLDIEFKGKRYSQVKLAAIGRHNVLNGLAVFGMALSLGIHEDEIRKAFATFGGVQRRCEKKGDIQNVLFIDDYAHHPTEIKTTVQGIRQAIGERRLIAVFQPHRYSRTKDCLGTYGGIFTAADEVIVTDIFGAGESPIIGVSHDSIISEIQKCSLNPCRYVPRQKLEQILIEHLRPHDALVTLGAGDITALSSKLIDKLHSQPIRKLRAGVIFGGQSAEHEISLISAKYVASGLRESSYDISHFGITKSGSWITGLDSMARLQTKAEPKEHLSSEVLQELLACDVLIPVLHGTFGEDGTIQGFFEMLGKSYVGCDHRSAAVCMDKAMSKRLVIAEGVDTTPFVEFTRFEWDKNSEKLHQRICNELSFPVFVKPSHLGSTIGVSKVNSPEHLEKAICKAFRCDTVLLVERGVDRPREIEFAVLGNDRIRVFPPGEICTGGAVYDYAAKYSAHGMSANAQADLPEDLKQEGMRLAEQVYRALGCKGFARVDFFLDGNGKFWFNECNPIPGFTKASLYPQICAANGLGIHDLIDRLVILALQYKRLQRGVALKDEE